MAVGFRRYGNVPGRTGNRVVATSTGSNSVYPIAAIDPQAYEFQGNPATQRGDLVRSGRDFVEAEAEKVASDAFSSQQQNQQGGYEELLRAILGSGSGGGGLDARRYQDERADRAARTRALQQYLSSGQLGNLSAGTRGAVESQYERALRNIDEGYGSALGITDTGYGGLSDYLSRTAVNPYQGLEFSAGLTSNPMEQFLEAYGAMSPDVQASVAAEQAARESGAGAFRGLADVLSGTSTEAQRSREAEAQMAANFARQFLGQQQAGYRSQADVSRQQALAQIAQQEAERQFALEQALIDSGVTPRKIDESGGDPTLSRLEQIAAGSNNLRQAAAQFAPKYMAENPNATPAQIRKQFPKLAAAVDAAKGK
jgi:hypothetical protein